MLKLKVVNREQVAASNQRLEALLAQDPSHQEEKRDPGETAPRLRAPHAGV